MLQSPLDTAFVGTDDDQFIPRNCQRRKVSVQDRSRVEMIDGHVEETLDLSRVQIHRKHSMSTCLNDQVGNQLRGDGDSSGILAILPCVAEIGDNRRDPRGTGAATGVDQDQQFDKILIHRRTGWLDEKHIAAANVLIQFDADFTIWKIAYVDLPEADAEKNGDLAGQVRVRPAGQNRQVLVHAHRTEDSARGSSVMLMAGDSSSTVPKTAQIADRREARNADNDRTPRQSAQDASMRETRECISVGMANVIDGPTGVAVSR